MKKRILILIVSILAGVSVTVSVVLALVLRKSDESGKDLPPSPPFAVYHNNYTVTKTVGGQAKTVSLGGEIIYNISVTNNSEIGLLVDVSDTIPANTTYLTGGEMGDDNTIFWNLSIDAYETHNVSYIVKVDNDEELLDGSQIVATTACAGEKAATCESIYVANTLNAFDRKCMAEGIRVLSYSEAIDDLYILKQMYQHAFSIAPELDGEPEVILDLIFEQTNTDSGNHLREMVIPTLYGGTEVASALDSKFVGNRELIEQRDLIEGDVLFIEHDDVVKMYVCNGKELILLDGGCKIVDSVAVIEGVVAADRYVALRPSINLTMAHYSGEMVITDDMSIEQKVLLATVQSYLNRGFRLQYDDTRMNYPYKTSSDKGERRWQIGQYEPEDYTTQKWGYTNCAAFTYDVYRTALGMDLGNLYITENLVKHYTDGGSVGVPMYPYYYQPNVTANETERNNIKTQFMNSLQIGDLIVVRRNNSSGHALIYVGNNMAVNSSGGSCAYDDTEVYESSIRYLNLDMYLFEPASTNYIFRTDGYITQLCVIRPLDIYNGEVPKNSINRLNNLDIFAEKLSSHPEGKTVNSGDDVTFRLNITNTGNFDKMVTITDVVPNNTVLKSVGNNATIDGVNISWVVNVKAGETVVVSYVVTAIGENGSYIYGTDTKIDGVRYTCSKIYIKNTLTTSQQNAIRNVVLGLLENNPNSLSKFALISEIYKQAGLADPFASVTESEFRSSLFRYTSGLAFGTNLYEFNKSSKYYDMVVDSIYGGRNFFTPDEYTSSQKINTNRTRLARGHSLVIGDILIAKFSSSEGCYIYIGGDRFINLSNTTIMEDTFDVNTRLMRMISARHYFCVLRPSQFI